VEFNHPCAKGREGKGKGKRTCSWNWESLRRCVLRVRMALSTSVILGFFTKMFPIPEPFLSRRRRGGLAWRGGCGEQERERLD